MTPNIPQEVLALARKVIDDIPAIDRDGDFALKISIAAIKETMELAAKLAEKSDGYNDVTGSLPSPPPSATWSI